MERIVIGNVWLHAPHWFGYESCVWYKSTLWLKSCRRMYLAWRVEDIIKYISGRNWLGLRNWLQILSLVNRLLTWLLESSLDGLWLLTRRIIEVTPVTTSPIVGGSRITLRRQGGRTTEIKEILNGYLWNSLSTARLLTCRRLLWLLKRH